jgi:hypothetical protein
MLQEVKVRDVLRMPSDDGWYLVATQRAIVNISTQRSQDV